MYICMYVCMCLKKYSTIFCVCVCIITYFYNVICLSSKLHYNILVDNTIKFRLPSTICNLVCPIWVKNERVIAIWKKIFSYEIHARLYHSYTCSTHATYTVLYLSPVYTTKYYQKCIYLYTIRKLRNFSIVWYHFYLYESNVVLVMIGNILE